MIGTDVTDQQIIEAQQVEIEELEAQLAFKVKSNCIKDYVIKELKERPTLSVTAMRKARTLELQAQLEAVREWFDSPSEDLDDLYEILNPKAAIGDMT